MVAGCEGALVSENHAHGTSDAEVYVMAKEEDPLQRAKAFAFGVSLANGILLGDVTELYSAQYGWHIPFCVKESNTFEAGANVDVTADVVNPDPWGLAAGIDAFIVFTGPGEYLSVNGQQYNLQHVDFNYNDLPGTQLSGAAGYVFDVDLGMLVVNLDTLGPDSLQSLSKVKGQQEDLLLLVDARYNYWGDPNLYPPTDPWDPAVFDPDNPDMLNVTGPGGLGFGTGQPIYVAGEGWETWVCWQPWLTINHEWCVDSHIGKFAKAIVYKPCWNTFSVPIQLDSTIDTWGTFKALNTDFAAKTGPAVYYNGTQWVLVDDAYPLLPLDGIKVYISAPTYVFILASTGDSLPYLPLREGWNLVGPNPPFCDPGMWAEDFVSSIVRTDGTGFSQLISQGGSQPNWSYTLGDWMSYYYSDYLLCVGKAYWVWVNSDGLTLAGFGFTPLGLYPDSYH
jgi:hypothetical protein